MGQRSCCKKGVRHVFGVPGKVDIRVCMHSIGVSVGWVATSACPSMSRSDVFNHRHHCFSAGMDTVHVDSYHILQIHLDS